MNESSTWTALRNPAFKRLWIGTVISGTCGAAHDSGATWTMNFFTGSPFLISFMSTVASLPLFLFILPAGALADNVDRKKLICFVNVGLAGMAAALAVLVWPHLLSPYLTPVSTFFIGVGFVGKRCAAVAVEATVPFRLALTPLVGKTLSLGAGAVYSIGGLYGSLESISGCRFPKRAFRARFLADSLFGKRIQCALQSNHFLSKRSPALYITSHSRGLLHKTNRN